MRWTGVRAMAGIVGVVARGELSRYGGRSPSVCDRLESELCSTLDIDHAVVVNSGTSALVCALVAAGVGPGDEVLVPAYTWVSSAAAPLSLGAIPVLVDIDESLTIDPVAAAAAVTDRTTAIIPVHMNNLPSDMDAVMKVAADHQLTVVEDACQAVGVTYHGRHLGTIGHVGALSFNQYKNITCGEGGAVVSSDALVATRAATYHDVGSFIRPPGVRAQVPAFVGVGLRMPETSAALLRPQLARLEHLIEARRRRRAILVAALTANERFPGRVAPHHDEASAASLAVIFDDPADAARFAERRAVTRLIDSGRHVFTNWEPIQQKRLHDDRLDPYQKHPHDIDYSGDRYARTLDILSRTCNVGLPPGLPAVAFHLLARQLSAWD